MSECPTLSSAVITAINIQHYNTMSKNKKSPESIIETASADCENANYHDRCGMAESLFASIKHLVPEADHVELAQAIADAVTHSI